MRPTFLGFETGRKGLAVAQKGLDITGQNLTNIGTPGYTRQRIDQVAVATDSYRSRYAGTRTQLAGQGVTLNGITQTRDSFLDKRFREEFSETYYYDQKYAILSDLENVVDEYGASSGMQDAMNEIFKALNQFSGKNSTDLSCANIVCTSFKSMTKLLQEYSNKLDNVASQHKYDLSVSVDYVNSTLSKLAGLNQQIAQDISLNKTNNEYYGPNELMDERNLLLDELSRYSQIDVAAQPDGSVTVSMNGHKVVEGSKNEQIDYTPRADGTVTLMWRSTGKEATFVTGAFKAAVEMINGRGPNIQSENETAERGVLYYKDRINTLAKTLADQINNIIPELNADGTPKLDADGNQVYKQLLGALIPDRNNPGQFVTSQEVEITAANISITDAWSQDSSYVIYKGTSEEGNKYINLMTQIINNKKSINFYNHGVPFTGTFEDYIKDISTTINGDTSYNVGRLTATGAISDELLNRRDSISGVSRDEETTNMMMYQKSFQAVSRLMTAMDDALDTIINKMGRVGL